MSILTFFCAGGGGEIDIFDVFGPIIVWFSSMDRSGGFGAVISFFCVMYRPRMTRFWCEYIYMYIDFVFLCGLSKSTSLFVRVKKSLGLNVSIEIDFFLCRWSNLTCFCLWAETR